MEHIVIIPGMIPFTSLILHIVSVYFTVRITNKIGLHLFNWMTTAMMVGIIRRVLDYAITFQPLSHHAYGVRYAELAYFPIAFSICIILGFIQIYNAYVLNEAKLRQIK